MDVIPQPIVIEKYSTLSFVVRGDTKAVAAQLKVIGGKWNARLMNGAGWIFSNNNLAKVTASLDQACIPYTNNYTSTIAIKQTQATPKVVPKAIQMVQPTISQLGSPQLGLSNFDISTLTPATKGNVLADLQNLRANLEHMRIYCTNAIQYVDSVTQLIQSDKGLEAD